MLVRRAVLRARQRYALAGRPLACRGVAAQRRPVERDPLAFALVHVLRGDLHVLLDRRVDAQLRLDREEDAHVVEQRACGSCEIVAVAREALEGALARLQEELAVVAGRCVTVLHHERSQLPVKRTAELIHVAGSPYPPCDAVPSVPPRARESLPPRGSVAANQC